VAEADTFGLLNLNSEALEPVQCEQCGSVWHVDWQPVLSKHEDEDEE
jgi:hypothetical protein